MHTLLPVRCVIHAHTVSDRGGLSVSGLAQSWVDTLEASSELRELFAKSI